jgi:ATP-dependent RNA helicase DeaD
LKAVADRGYSEPMPVQAAVMEQEALGRDLLVSAQTGSGKTVAFGFVLAAELLGDSPKFSPAPRPLALVVAPTRELAMQVRRELGWLFVPTAAEVVACVGGMDIRKEQRALELGPHIVVGTPGRLCDHLDHGRLDLSGIRVLVLDEADEMLDMGFRDELERLLEATPTERRTLMFSATLPREISAMAARYQRDALRIALASASEPHGDIEYRAVLVVPAEREHAVVNTLRYLDAHGALVFCATRETVRHLHGYLVERGFTAVALSGELNQTERNRALQALRDGRARVCVATDVAARGLDLPDLGVVIHADLPRDSIALLHRSGRTGRAGHKGVAVVMVPVNLRRTAQRILDVARVEPLWSTPPGAESIRRLDQERLVRDIGAQTEEAAEEDVAAARILLADHSPEDLVAALVRLHRAQYPAPEEVTESLNIRSEPPERSSRRERPELDMGNGEGDDGWFRLNVGRSQNADPRWIVPMLCRRGRVTKAEIGKIIIFQHETVFEIARRARDRFAASVRRPDRSDPGIRILPARRH